MPPTRDESRRDAASCLNRPARLLLLAVAVIHCGDEALRPDDSRQGCDVRAEPIPAAQPWNRSAVLASAEVLAREALQFVGGFSDEVIAAVTSRRPTRSSIASGLWICRETWSGTTVVGVTEGDGQLVLCKARLSMTGSIPKDGNLWRITESCVLPDSGELAIASTALEILGAAPAMNDAEDEDVLAGEWVHDPTQGSFELVAASTAGVRSMAGLGTRRMRNGLIAAPQRLELAKEHVMSALVSRMRLRADAEVAPSSDTGGEVVAGRFALAAVTFLDAWKRGHPRGDVAAPVIFVAAAASTAGTLERLSENLETVGREIVAGRAEMSADRAVAWDAEELVIASWVVAGIRSGRMEPAEAERLCTSIRIRRLREYLRALATGER